MIIQTTRFFAKIIFWWMYTSVTLEEVKLIPAVINCNNPLFLRAENVHNKKVTNGEGMDMLTGVGVTIVNLISIGVVNNKTNYIELTSYF